MTTIWLTRHAESAAPTVFHGAESNVGLSELGRQQAAAAASWFKPHAPTVVVSSAMTRAKETAAPIAAVCGVPHHLEPDLHERRVGELGGTSFSSQSGPWHDTIHRWMVGDTAYTTPGAESFDELRNRLVPALERVARLVTSTALTLFVVPILYTLLIRDKKHPHPHDKHRPETE